MTCHQNRQLPPWLQNMDRIIASPPHFKIWTGSLPDPAPVEGGTASFQQPPTTLPAKHCFSLLKKSRYTLIKSVVDVWMYKPWNEHFSFVWNDKYKKSNSIANRVIPKKCFIECYSIISSVSYRNWVGSKAPKLHSWTNLAPEHSILVRIFGLQQYSFGSHYRVLFVIESKIVNL